VNRAATERELPPDPFPTQIDVQRARRRTVELGLHDGRLIAQAPLRIPKEELQRMLVELRRDLWDSYRESHCFGAEGLARCATNARIRWLADVRLPGFSVRFAGRMKKRWASCTAPVAAGHDGSVRVSRVLEGHPNWLLEHLLLHELIHLVHPNHGRAFKALMGRSPFGERAAGYLEALTGDGEWGRGRRRGRDGAIASVEGVWKAEEGQPSLPLFDS
jgi:hypothetical protein